LFFSREFLVGIIDMAVELEQSELQYGKSEYTMATKDTGAPRLHTISSLQIGHRRLDGSPALPFGCAPTLMLEPISWLRSARLPLAGGDIDDEATETVLSDGAKGLDDRAGGVGPRPLPLPRILPPPSLRDMVMGCVAKQRTENNQSRKEAQRAQQADQNRPIRASSCIAEAWQSRADQSARQG
jgi:hypothetical protein